MKTAMMLLVVMLCTLWAPYAHCGDCQKCHASFDDNYMRPALPAIRLRAAGHNDVLTLADLYREHGHPCVGTAIAFRAIQHGIRELYGDTVPQRDDLVIFSRIAGPGVVGAIDRIMQGPVPATKTAVPDGMKLARENFVFSLLRISTGDMVTVGLKPEILPRDFFPLKSRMKTRDLSPDQWQVLHGYIRQAVGVVSREPDEKLFEVTRISPQVVWGMTPAAVTDRIMPLQSESTSLRP